MSKSGIVGSTFAWIFAVLLAVLFIYAGGAKLTGNPGMVREFAQIGLGQWLRYFTGILEVSGAVGVLIPTLRFWAALLIAAVMAGATVTNLFILHIPVLAKLTSVLLGLALALAWLRRPSINRNEVGGLCMNRSCYGIHVADSSALAQERSRISRIGIFAG